MENPDVKWKRTVVFDVANIVDIAQTHLPGRIRSISKTVKLRKLQEDEIHSTTHLKYKLKYRSTEPRNKVLHYFYFVKVHPSLQQNYTVMRTLDLLPRLKKEIYAYKVIIPTLKRFQLHFRGRNNVEENYADLFPKCYVARNSISEETEDDTDLNAAIVMDDLSLQDYKTIDFREGIDLDNIKSILRVMARYHAVGLAYKLIKPGKFRRFIEPGLAITNASPESYVCVPSEVDYLKKHILQTSWKSNMDKVDSLLKYSLTNMAESNKETWVGLCHGKFLLFNVMRRVYDVPTHLVFKIIDLQHQVKRHVLTDLVMFLVTSFEENISREKCKEVLYYYYEEFIGNLRRYRGIKLEDYSKDVFEVELYDIFRKNILRSLQMVRFICCKDETRDKIRPATAWPRYDILEVENSIDVRIYFKRLSDILTNVIENGIFDP